MVKYKHRAIYGSGLSMKAPFFQNLLKGQVPDELIELKGKKGALFSNYTLEKFIKEEAIHDDYSLSYKEGRSIRTFSSGEQKKALLNHLLSSQPGFLVLDNAFAMLDKKASTELQERLCELSEKIPLLQVFKRKDNLLPFISDALRIENGEIVFTGTLDAYREKYTKQQTYQMNGSLPAPTGEIQNPILLSLLPTIRGKTIWLVKGILI